MFIRAEDQGAYNTVYKAEILLRRMLRWELRGIDGRSWYGELGPIVDEVENRMASEKRQGRFHPGYSLFSYLSLTELLNLIFNVLWHGRFQRVFSNRRNLRHAEFKNLICVRNKIGHFRAVSRMDIRDLAAVSEVQNEVLEHYQNKEKVAAYVSGAFEYADEQINQEVTKPLVEELKRHGRNDLWDSYQLFDEYRAIGMSPGIGLIHHHVFFEFYTHGSFLSKHLLEFVERNENELTFMNVGANSHFVRIFVPLIFPASLIKRTAKKFARACKADMSDDSCDRDCTITRFQIGRRDSVQGDAINTYTGFLF